MGSGGQQRGFDIANAPNNQHLSLSSIAGQDADPTLSFTTNSAGAEPNQMGIRGSGGSFRYENATAAVWSEPIGQAVQ